MRPNSPKVLWGRLDQTSGPDGCWPWMGTLHSGYGRISIDGKDLSTHRLAYELTHGPIPTGMVVRHRCDNPPCCNPRHLELGTSRDNTRDMHERQRWCNRKGSRHPLAKLTEGQVLEIRRLWVAGARNVDLANGFGVSPPTITRLTKHEGWTHVQGGPA